jgi:hypothetical protein
MIWNDVSPYIAIVAGSDYSLLVTGGFCFPLILVPEK